MARKDDPPLGIPTIGPLFTSTLCHSFNGYKYLTDYILLGPGSLKYMYNNLKAELILLTEQRLNFSSIEE